MHLRNDAIGPLLRICKMTKTEANSFPKKPMESGVDAVGRAFALA